MLDHDANEAIAHGSTGSTAGSQEQIEASREVLSCTLTWLGGPSTDMYHIFYQSRKKGSGVLGDSAQCRHLGSTGLSTFRAVGMRLHGTDDAICIAVSTSSLMLCQTFPDWTTSLSIVL